MNLYDSIVYDVIGNGSGGGGGGGSSRLVYGEFTTQDADGWQTVSIPYSGQGNPLFVGVYCTDGIETGTVSKIIQQQVLVEFVAVREYLNVAPVYSNSYVNGNRATVTTLHKSSTTVATNLSAMYDEKLVFFRETVNESTTTRTEMMCMTSNKTLHLKTVSTGNGFLRNQKYTYVIAYTEEVTP